MKVVIDKKVLEQYLHSLKTDLNEMLDDGNWPMPSDDRQPAVVTEPPMDADAVVITPATEDQVHEPNMPVDDPEWQPGNNNELSKATSQLVQQVPEGQRNWFWGRIKNLVAKTVQNIEGQPGAGDMEYEAEALPTDKQSQKSSEPWRERQGLTPGQ